MLADFERRKIENDLVSREMRRTLRLSLGILAFVIACSVVSYFVKRHPIPPDNIKDLWPLIWMPAILLIIVVLAVRKTIYFSPRLIRGEFKLASILKIWSKIDTWLLLCPVIIALLGLTITFILMPFSWTWTFFVSAFLLTMILMPIPWKVKDKIRYFEKFMGRWDA